MFSAPRFRCATNSSFHFDLKHEVKSSSDPPLRVTVASNEWAWFGGNTGTKAEKCIACLQALFLYQLMVMGMDQLYFLLNSLDNPGASRCFSAQTYMQTALIWSSFQLVVLQIQTPAFFTSRSITEKWQIKTHTETILNFVISHLLKKLLIKSLKWPIQPWAMSICISLSTI